MNINNIIGHNVEATIMFSSYGQKKEHKMTGKIIYSTMNASLMFKEKGQRNRGYLIKDEKDVLEVKLIRKDNKNNAYYSELYLNDESYKKERNERIEKEDQEREQKELQRQKEWEDKRNKEKEDKKKYIDEMKKLNDYERIEKETIDFYESFEGEFYNKYFVSDTLIPLLVQLYNRSIESVNHLPNYQLSKSRNPKFVAMIEKVLSIKLKNSHKENVSTLNQYLLKEEKTAV